MRKFFVVLIVVLSFQSIGFAQLVGERLAIGSVVTFESESGPGLFLSYGATTGRAALNGANRKFKIVPPLNGKAGFVSLQAVDLAGEVYLVMAEVCPRPYTSSFYYNVTAKPSTDDPTFNLNASFEVRKGNSNQQNEGLVSLRVKNGTHFVKREQGVLMASPGGGVAPQYQNHFTFKIPVAPKNVLAAGQTLNEGKTLFSANGKFGLVMQTDGHLCMYKFNNGVQGDFVWANGVYPFTGSKLVMQEDGNLCVYEGATFRWGTFQTKNYTLGKNYSLVLTDDGKLNIINPAGAVLWTNQ